MNIDGMVRETLHSYADGAPLGAGLLDAAQARARRRRARHAGLATAAAVAAVLVAVSIPFGASVGEGPAVPGSGNPPFAPVELVEPAIELPSFPFTPGWIPDGIEAPYVSYDKYGGAWSLPQQQPGGGALYGPSEPFLGLIHPRATVPAPEPLIVEVHTADPTANLEQHAEEPVTVHGRPGTRYRISDQYEYVVVAWQHEPDLWVLVRGAGLDAADVERYAAELEETPIHPEAPFAFDLLPAGMVLTGSGPDWMRFHRDDGVGVHVDLTAAAPSGEPTMPAPSEPSGTPTAEAGLASPPPPAPTLIEVDGRTATLFEWSERTELSIPLDQDWILGVTGDLMNPEDVVRVAAGIEVVRP